MRFGTALRNSIGEGWLGGASSRHGMQLAVAVIASYLASAALGLPEGFWAVMSALIVVRPDAGATLGAGWERVRGTVVGTVCGLLGVWLRHTGVGAPQATLAIVALLAFASAGTPILRSAPITALIVLSSGGIAGHTALQVAGLRVAQIAIGVVVGLIVSVAVPSARAAARFNAECASILRLVRAHVDRSLAVSSDSTESSTRIRQAFGVQMRAELRQLALLARSVQRESRFFLSRSTKNTSSGTTHERIAQLLTRCYQDAGLLVRVFDALPQRRDDPLWAELAKVVCAALDSLADALTDTTAPLQLRPALAALAEVDTALAERRLAAPNADEPATLLAGPLHLLRDDLRALARWIGAAHGRAGHIDRTTNPETEK
jgi:uncharacterized membrane protein YgaE (UPF0421/DUF939 family)